MALEMRHLRSDLVEVYKIMHNFESLRRKHFFPLRTAGRRGHHYTINKHLSRFNGRKHFFSQRVVDQLNRLPTATVCAETINMFKNQIEQKLMLWQYMGPGFLANVGFQFSSYRPTRAPKCNGHLSGSW